MCMRSVYAWHSRITRDTIVTNSLIDNIFIHYIYLANGYVFSDIGFTSTKIALIQIYDMQFYLV